MNETAISTIPGLPQQNLARRFAERHILSDEQIEKTVREAQEAGESFADAVVRLKMAPRETVFSELAGIYGVPFVDLRNYNYDPSVVSMVDENTARELDIVPLFAIDQTLTIAMADPGDITVLDRVASTIKHAVETCLASRADIRDMINRLYGRHTQVKAFLDRMDDTNAPTQTDSLQDMLRSGESPISQLIDLILAQAGRDRASDIHIAPDENGVRIRFRIDGVLHDVPPPPKYLHPFIVSRVKILSNMDIAESRIPQDGQFQTIIDGRTVDARVSSLPSIHGEDISIRLFDAQAALTDLTSLGLSPVALGRVENMLLARSGIIVISGPTGSGKTTTLYAMLERARAPDRNIITIEDPVERRIRQVVQVQTNEKAGLTFASALRSILRHDPDIIMVGEVRDAETAQLAIRAALTGHLVFSTIHTNTAPSVVMRLINMGIEPLLVAAALTGVVAQRLARRICPQCGEKNPLLPAVRHRIKALSSVIPSTTMRGKGCPQCRNTGYHGRLGLFEIMAVTPALGEGITSGSTAAELRQQAVKDGMITLMDDGLQKVGLDLTSIEEVMRIAEMELSPSPESASGDEIAAVSASFTAPPASAKPVTKPTPPSEPFPAKETSLNLESYRAKIANWLGQSPG
jgi:type IV pilus assembly protein PilB